MSLKKIDGKINITDGNIIKKQINTSKIHQEAKHPEKGDEIRKEGETPRNEHKIISYV